MLISLCGQPPCATASTMCICGSSFPYKHESFPQLCVESPMTLSLLPKHSCGRQLHDTDTRNTRSFDLNNDSILPNAGAQPFAPRTNAPSWPRQPPTRLSKTHLANQQLDRVSHASQQPTIRSTALDRQHVLGHLFARWRRTRMPNLPWLFEHRRLFKDGLHSFWDHRCLATVRCKS